MSKVEICKLGKHPLGSDPENCDSCWGYQFASSLLNDGRWRPEDARRSPWPWLSGSGGRRKEKGK